MSDTPKKQKPSKSKRNRTSSIRLLESHGIEYITNNDGVHLIVTGNYSFIDFWPGTGKWKTRDNAMSGFGVFGLLEMINAGQI
jgi:hypothetical protein